MAVVLARQLTHDAPTLDARPAPSLRVRTWRQRGPTARWPAGAHHPLEVAWVEAGLITYRLGTRTIEVGAGQAIIVPPEVEHATAIAPGVRAGSVWLERSLIDGVASALPSARRTRLLPGLAERGARIAALVSLLIIEATTADEGALVASEALGEALAIETLRVAPSERRAADPTDPRVRAAIDHLERHAHTPLSIDDLARVAGMSRFHFTRLFGQQVGLSPYRFLIVTRVRHAAQLLRTGRYSVTEAALSSGFSDLGRFARAFRRELGCAPSSMARGARAAT